VASDSKRVCENLKRNRKPVGFEKRTSAAEAVEHRRFTARLKPCPSYRDAFSFSFLAVAPRQQFIQNMPSQLKAVKHVCPALRSTVSSPRLHAQSKLVN
jgi:hypothetical protein